MKIVEVRHPLVQHKLGLMRRADNSTKTFRELSAEVATLLTYEATADLETEEADVEGWAGTVRVRRAKPGRLPNRRRTSRLRWQSSAVSAKKQTLLSPRQGRARTNSGSATRTSVTCRRRMRCILQHVTSIITVRRSWGAEARVTPP